MRRRWKDFVVVGIVLFIVVATFLHMMFNVADPPEEYSQNRDQIVKIEFISVVKNYKGSYDDCPTILVVEPEQYDKFFSDFDELKWYYYAPPGPYIRGKGIRITYSNGEYMVVGCGGNYLSEKKDCFDDSLAARSESWDAFLDKYGLAPNYPDD